MNPFNFNKSFLFATILSCVSIASRAQIDESYRYTYAEFDTTAIHKLFFRLENNNFIKNNEYFGEYTEGYTLPGYSIQPSVMYYAGKNVRLKVGAQIMKYSGIEDYTNVVPIFSAHVKLGDTWNMVLGNLKGNVHHKLIEPLFNSEWQHFRPTETGVQFYHQSPKIWLDTWVDWEQFIFSGDSIPEMFTAGANIDYKITRPDSKFNISIPIQVTAFHLGGQISDYLTESYSLINTVTGLDISQKTGSSFIEEIGLSSYFCTYNDLTEARALPFRTGSAVYTAGIVTYKRGQFMLGYWSATDYFSPKGNILFSSVSDKSLDYYTQNRQMITSKFTFNKTIMSKVKFSAQLESYYDIDVSRFEYSYGISLIFTPNFLITKLGFE